jgi:hypothetical protein
VVAVEVQLDLRDFERRYREALLRQVGERLGRVAAAVGAPAREAVRAAVEATPHYASLLAGDLRKEFGLADAAGAVEGVVRALEASARTAARPPAGGDLGGVTVSLFRSDFSDALSADGASYVSDGRRGAFDIEWLSWLLFDGDAVVVEDYGVVTGVPTQRSRTGDAIMSPVGRGDRLRPWRVPPAFSGTAYANWLTEAAGRAGPLVRDLLVREGRAAFR